MWVQSLGWEDPLEEEMASHFSILAWRFPRTEEPGRLQSIGSHRVRPGLSQTGLQHTCMLTSVFLSSLQSFSEVQLFVTPWTAACQASQSITNSWSLLKLMSIESVMPSNHLILCCPLLLPPSIFPSIRVFSNESVFKSGGQSIGVSASASVLPVNIQS